MSSIKDEFNNFNKISVFEGLQYLVFFLLKAMETLENDDIQVRFKSLTGCFRPSGHGLPTTAPDVEQKGDLWIKGQQKKIMLTMAIILMQVLGKGKKK